MGKRARPLCAVPDRGKRGRSEGKSHRREFTHEQETRGDAGLSSPFVLAPQKENGEPYTNSEIIAEGANVKHRAIQQLITKHEADFNEFGVIAFEMRKLGGRGGVHNCRRGGGVCRTAAQNRT